MAKPQKIKNGFLQWAEDNGGIARNGAVEKR
jgi:hypothetical protein